MEHVPSPTSAVLAGLLQHRLDHHPDGILDVFPLRTGGLGFINYRDFGLGCRRFIRAICPQAPVTRGTVVGLILQCDTLMYQTAICGLIRAGLTVFPISPRFPPGTICDLLQSVSVCRVLITSTASESLLNDMRAEMDKRQYNITFENLPSFEDIFPEIFGLVDRDSNELDAVPLPTADAYPDGVELWLHSSGSTGQPKPLPLTHAFIHKMQFSQNFAWLMQRDTPIVMNTSFLPMFHMMGISTHIIQPLMTGTIASIFGINYPSIPPPPTPRLVIDVMRKTDATAACVAPTFLEAWSHDESSIGFLKTLVFIYYGGGPLATAAGNRLVAHGVNIASAYGSTELGPMTNSFRNVGTKDDWAWIQLSNHVTSQWIPQDGDLFELHVMSSDTQPMAVTNLPDGNGYATGDLFLKHPSIEGLWKIVGRVDSWIVMSNGEKMLPGLLENALLAHPDIRGAVVFGRGQDCVGVLIELKNAKLSYSVDEQLAMRELFWPLLKEVNGRMPSHSRVFKDMVIFAVSSKPLPRAAKGSVNQKATWIDYQHEIGQLYANKAQVVDQNTAFPAHFSYETLLAWISELVKSLHDGPAIASHSDLFTHGFDSLTATLLRGRIVSAMRLSQNTTISLATIEPDVVYRNATIAGLASYLLSLLEGQPRCPSLDHIDLVQAMIAKYPIELPRRLDARLADLPEDVTVLLTGSTGGLGSAILDRILKNAKVSKVYVLNRHSSTGKTSRERQLDAFNDRCLDAAALVSPKLVFLQGDAGDPLLGLAQPIYEEVRAAIDVVIHNAWRLDFNMNLASYEGSIRATHRLIDLAASSPRLSHIRFLFTSSVAVAQASSRTCEFPEDNCGDPGLCVGTGYGESKYVAEQMLYQAHTQGLRTTSLRIGQICGASPVGAWAATDWVPILVKTSLTLGCLPDAEGMITWIPYTTVAQVVMDIALGSPNPSSVLNVVHPRPVPWNSIMQDIAKALVEQDVANVPLELIPFNSWYEKLERHSFASSEKDLLALPGLMLLRFFGRLTTADDRKMESPNNVLRSASFAIDKALDASLALREAEPLSAGDVANWVRYWKGKGMFSQM